MSERPIGIFDSGIGGLTVCRAVRDLLPSENIVYFGDTARFPYGTRSQDTIIRYSREITEYLTSRNVKMIVIACNTASAAALETLRTECSVPVIGVIEAGARAACARSQNGPIGVIGTRATVNSGSYVKAIRRIRPDSAVIQQQATLFVSLAEEGLTQTEIARLAAREYLEGMYGSGVRTLILGCTHFPLLKKSIKTVYPDIDLVDTGEEIAHEVSSILQERQIFRNSDEPGTVELYASDLTESMQLLKEKFFGINTARLTKLVI